MSNRPTSQPTSPLETPPTSRDTPPSDPTSTPPSAAPTSGHCPECETADVVTHQDGDTVCRDCGLILESREAIDHGPEWRSFTPSDRRTRCRTGPARDPSETDYGHATFMGHASGSEIAAMSGRRQTVLSRMQQLDRRHNTRDNAGDRPKTAYGLTEVNRMMTSLGYHDSHTQQAAHLFRQGQARQLAVGRSIEAHAAAAVYAALRIDRAPVTLADVARVARVDRQAITTMYDVLMRDLELPVPPQRPVDYVPRIASAIEAPTALERAARELLTAVSDTPVAQGKHPAGLAAGAINALQELTPPGHYFEETTETPFTQTALAEEAGVAAQTVRVGTERFEAVLCGDDSEFRGVSASVEAPIVCPRAAA